ncbi:hypothetical protein BDN70DRAFT_116862 [Pholiota conissans]|uniref:Uncharacterized protein n=1 Tax=Pholiota conissans TaxID=109636 RepID=A0A9P5YZ90_9AGAR|nr:hypothetical protein BDN70DRAFT_116862 [Pholiota conissans]
MTYANSVRQSDKTDIDNRRDSALLKSLVFAFVSCSFSPASIYLIRGAKFAYAFAIPRAFCTYVCTRPPPPRAVKEGTCYTTFHCLLWEMASWTSTHMKTCTFIIICAHGIDM